MRKWLIGLFRNHNTNDVTDGGMKAEEKECAAPGDTRETEAAEELQTALEESPETGNADAQPNKIFLKRNKFPRQRKPWSVRKKTIVFACIGTAAALLIAGGAWALTIISDPLAQFTAPANTESSAHTGTAQAGIEAGGEATPTATVDPEDLLLSEADLSILSENFINIMLIGVDRSEERESDGWKGKTDFHADVMIVLTINRETGQVSMISLPRDTYAKIPGVGGIYKLNASLNCGGGWCEEGFEKVCQAAQWMLGGSGGEDDPIQIDYYFAVDMNAVKGLVDNIGGVDYDLDISFSIQGRSYTRGDGVHMDGQAVLDYLRVRKEAHGGTEGIASEDADGETGDMNRVNRQKKMLVAIFEKIKDNGLLPSIPGLIAAFDGNLAYNMSVGQIAALAYYALSVDPDTIRMYSMSGAYVTVITGDSFYYPLAFTFTNQSNRIKIISEVYGVEVKNRSSHTLNSLRLLWGKLQAKQYAKAVKPILSKAKEMLDESAEPTPEPTPSASQEPTETPSSDPPASSGMPAMSETADEAATLARAGVKAGGNQQVGDEERAFYNQVYDEYQKALNWDSYSSGKDLLDLLAQLRTDTIALCDMLGISQPSGDSWHYDFVNKYNDIYVDMR
jgi:LCP family protein required for cell wall assembly